QLEGGRRAMDRALVAIRRHQPGDVAAVVDMRVRENDRPYAVGAERRRRPVAMAQLLVALKQTAVHQQAAVAGLQNVTGAGHRATGTEKTESQAHMHSIRNYRGARIRIPTYIHQ